MDLPVLFVLTLFAELIANNADAGARTTAMVLPRAVVDYADPDPTSCPAATADRGRLLATGDFVQEFDRGGGWASGRRSRSAADSWCATSACLPAPPSARNWLGTDDQGRDVVARVIYGFRISVLFGFTLTIVSSIIGVVAGAVQGYFGGWIDLTSSASSRSGSGMPQLYLLIILASVIEPSFWWLLGFLLLFSWMALTGVVRAEFLRARNFDYVRAAKALGVHDDLVIMWRHILPNAMVATLTFLPFILSGSSRCSSPRSTSSASACRRARPRSARWSRRARTTCRRPGSASPPSRCSRSC
jgi:microcin C transport system permease protein